MGFKIGDRVRTKHPIRDWDGHRGVIVSHGGYVWNIKIDRMTPFLTMRFHDGIAGYSEIYLKADKPLTPFEQDLKNYIQEELYA